MRELLSISPVALGKIPAWLRQMLKTAFPDVQLEQCPETEARTLHKFLEEIDLDHCGTTQWHEIKNCFVSEPYGVNAEALKRLREKGRKFGFAVAHDSLSHHYPGGCERIVLFPTTVRLGSLSHPAAVRALVDATSMSLNMPNMQKAQYILSIKYSGKALSAVGVNKTSILFTKTTNSGGVDRTGGKAELFKHSSFIRGSIVSKDKREKKRRHRVWCLLKRSISENDACGTLF